MAVDTTTQINDEYDQLLRNAILYGTAFYMVQMTQGGGFKARVIPYSEYAELGEALRNFPARDITKDIE